MWSIALVAYAFGRDCQLLYGYVWMPSLFEASHRDSDTEDAATEAADSGREDPP